MHWASGVASLSPAVTFSADWSMAAESTLLPVESLAIRSDCRIGMPLCRSVPRMRANRAMARFRKIWPAPGSRNRQPSMSSRPRSDRSQFRVVSEFCADVRPTQEPPHDRFRALGDVQVPMAEPMQHTLTARFRLEFEDLLEDVKDGFVDAVMIAMIHAPVERDDVPPHVACEGRTIGIAAAALSVT